MSQNRPVSTFIEKNFLHFNAAALVDAARGYKKHLADGKKMMITLAVIAIVTVSPIITRSGMVCSIVSSGLQGWGSTT